MELTGYFSNGRFEHKYLVPDRVAVAVRDALMPHIEIDGHMPPQSARGYAVYSLYFDTPGLDFYHHTRQRARSRMKLRVRFYTQDPAGAAFIEIKEKINGQVYKRRFRTDKKFIESMLTDPNCDELQHALGNGARGSALEEFCKRRQELRAAPKLFVVYDREAYNSKTKPMVRVTFDRRISATPCSVASALKMPRYGSNVGGLNVLIEFKYSGEPPQWLADVIKRFDLQRGPFSKFAECMDVLGISGQPPRLLKVGIRKKTSQP